MLKTFQDVERYLCLVCSIRFELVRSNTDFCGNLGDWFRILCPRYGNVGWNGRLKLEWERSDVACFLAIEIGVSRCDNIVQEHCDRHRPDTTWNGCDVGCDLGCCGIVNVADQALSGLL